jgi:hypothetical protein
VLLHHARARRPVAPLVVRTEGDACLMVRDHVGTLATIYADEMSWREDNCRVPNGT